MTINLIFDKTTGGYVCVDVFGQTVPFQNTEVNFLSKQMKYFGNLTVDSVSQNGRIVILKDWKNAIFASFNGNIPFRLNIFTKNQGNMPLIKSLEHFSIAEKGIPKCKMLLVTDEMAKRLKRSWGEEFVPTIEEHRSYRLMDMENISNEEQLQMKSLCGATRVALNKDIANRKKDEKNLKEEIAILNSTGLLKVNEKLGFLGGFMAQRTDTQSQISGEYVKNEVSFDNFEYFEDVFRQCINIAELNDQQKINPVTDKDVIWPQKPNQMGEKSFGRK